MRKILVVGDKRFVVTVPDDATLTFGPWSPPREGPEKGVYGREEKRGTLRIYEHGLKSKIMAVFSGVTSFRDMSIGYAEEVVREEGAVIWKDDEKGYYRDAKSSATREWVTPELEKGDM